MPHVDDSAPSEPARSKRLRLMSDCGLFPLWIGGGLTSTDARDRLGLADDLVDDLQQWGWEGDYVQGPPGGWDAWDERGADLQRRLQEALGSEYDVEYVRSRFSS